MGLGFLGKRNAFGEFPCRLFLGEAWAVLASAQLLHDTETVGGGIPDVLDFVVLGLLDSPQQLPVIIEPLEHDHRVVDIDCRPAYIPVLVLN